jgi:hypothetical protein
MNKEHKLRKLNVYDTQGEMTDTSGSETESGATPKKKMSICQIAKVRNDEVDKYMFMNQKSTRVIRIIDKAPVDTVILLDDTSVVTDTVYKIGGFSNIDNKVEAHAKRNTLECVELGWSSRKEFRLFHEILNEERVQGRGEVLITQYPSVFAKVKAEAYVLMVQNKGKARIIRTMHLQEQNRPGLLWAPYNGAKEILSSIKKVIRMRTGCAFGRIIEVSPEEVLYVPTTSVGPMSYLRTISNMVREWRKELGLGPNYKPGDIYRRMQNGDQAAIRQR